MLLLTGWVENCGGCNTGLHKREYGGNLKSRHRNVTKLNNFRMIIMIQIPGAGKKTEGIEVVNKGLLPAGSLVICNNLSCA